MLLVLSSELESDAEGVDEESSTLTVVLSVLVELSCVEALPSFLSQPVIAQSIDKAKTNAKIFFKKIILSMFTAFIGVLCELREVAAF